QSHRPIVAVLERHLRLVALVSDLLQPRPQLVRHVNHTRHHHITTCTTTMINEPAISDHPITWTNHSDSPVSGSKPAARRVLTSSSRHTSSTLCCGWYHFTRWWIRPTRLRASAQR